MDKTRILLASLLKPVNEPRMYEKIGKSLTQLPDVDVHICGYRATYALSNLPNLFLHPLFLFKRLSFGRFAAQFSYLKFLLKLKPNLVIVATHELLLVTIFYKLISGCTVIYDVQENYYRNLKYQHNYPASLKFLLAGLIRLFEKATATFITHFFLAEENYAMELPFLKGRFTILENKFKAPETEIIADQFQPVTLNTKALKLVYSGTISETYGIFEAIAFAEKVHQVYPETTLTVIGYCANEQTYEKLLSKISGKSFIRLIGGNKPVPYPEIITEIKKADLGLVSYQPNESTFRCRPTKIFEYLAFNLPMVVQQNPYWQQLLEENKAGLFIDFQQPAIPEILKSIAEIIFYKTAKKTGIFWKSEEVKLLNTVKRILSNS